MTTARCAGPSACCPQSATPDALRAAASSCLKSLDMRTEECEHERTAANATQVPDISCLQSEQAAGFLIVARSRTPRLVCTGGDIFRAAFAGEADNDSIPAAHFGGLATAIDGFPGVYWMDARALLQSTTRTLLRIRLTLVSTQNRSLQAAEGRGALVWNVSHSSPLRLWYRDHICVGQTAKDHHWKLRLPGERVSQLDCGEATSTPPANMEATSTPPAAEPRCIEMPRRPEASLYLDSGGAQSAGGGCRSLCSGNVTRIFASFGGAFARPSSKVSEPRTNWAHKLGYRHVLKPLGCHFHWYSEEEISQCLGNRKILNMGGSMANALQACFADPNARTGPCTRACHVISRRRWGSSGSTQR